VLNGTLDLRTGELRAHRRGDLLSKLVRIAYDPTALCELWDGVLWQWLDGSEELYSYVQRMVGYLLTGLTVEQVLHFLHGRGLNGKSVFAETLVEVLGDYAIVASPELVMVRRHSGIPNDIARLRGARLVVMNETNQEARFDEAKLKDLTGSDRLTGRFLHQEFFDFQPTHKLLIRGNHRPAIAGTDEAIWRRFRLVPFTVQIPPGEQDRRLVEKLRGELPGILRWCVDGCLAWQREGLAPPESVVAAVREYRTESDLLGRFIVEHCRDNNLGHIKSSVFFGAYQRYAKQAAERWIPSKDLPHEMQRRGVQWKRTNTGGVYVGLEFTSAVDPFLTESDGR
jgi:putative DNA primase/helicase